MRIFYLFLSFFFLVPCFKFSFLYIFKKIEGNSVIKENSKKTGQHELSHIPGPIFSAQKHGTSHYSDEHIQRYLRLVRYSRLEAGVGKGHLSPPTLKSEWVANL
jgi:hypothetical protein